MKRHLFFIFIISLSFPYSCTQPQAKTAILTREVFLDSVNKPNVQLADIRTPEEYATEGNFPKAKNIDFLAEDFYKQMEAHFDKSKPLYIHCKRGVKSHKSITKLQQLGFREIYELQGGYDDWQGEE